MNSKEFHQQTIFGLIQTTVNRTYTDLARRLLIDVNVQEHIVDWTNLRTLTNEIDWLFDREIDSQREAISIQNLIIEIHTKAPTIYTILTDSAEFDQALINGIKAYSRYIKRDNLAPATGPGTIRQTFSQQIKWEILQKQQRHNQISTRTSRYLEYRYSLRAIINQFFRRN